MRRPSKAALIRLICALAAVISGICILIARQSQQPVTPTGSDTDYEITVIAPTCTEKGYSLYHNPLTGETLTRDIVPATGHRFGAWETVQEQQGAELGLRRKICSVCGAEEQEAVFPQDDFPKLLLTGQVDGIGKKKELPVTARFEGLGQRFTDEAMLKYQGHSSLKYDKKNFTLKLYLNEGHTEKDKRTFFSWRPENKYILKANAIDASQVRNLICADIWADMVASRAQIPKRLQGLSNYGAVDGFPLALYMNDRFYGLYTLNLHKDDDLFGMKKGARDAIVIINDVKTDASRFRQAAAFDEEDDWEVEFSGLEDPAWAQDKLNALIEFVRTSDDAAFRAELQDYLDVDAALDYLLALYALGLTDNGTKDLVLVCFDDGLWIPSLYDLEDGFGLTADGLGYAAADDFLPTLENGTWSSATGSLLWDRILQNFLPELQTRYRQLRTGVLTDEGVFKRIENAVSGIPAIYYEADARAFPELPRPEGDPAAQMKQDFTRRIAALDRIFSE